MAHVAANLARAPDWLAAHSSSIDWAYLGSVDAHIRASQVAADLFAADYTACPQHYVPAALPQLPFPDRNSALTVSGHLLFVNHSLSVDNHIAALHELARVTHGEVRLYPTVDPPGVPYPYLDQVGTALVRHGISTELRPSPRDGSSEETTLSSAPHPAEQPGQGSTTEQAQERAWGRLVSRAMD